MSFDINSSILVGDAFLEDLNYKYCVRMGRRFGKMHCKKLVAAAYNAGEPNVKKAGFNVPRIPETINYVRIFVRKFFG